MGIGILALITSLVIAGVAAYFSIAGLMAIFSGAALAVAVMAGSLEVGKLVTASWLYRNWKDTGILLKAYLTIAVAVLMFITSLGIFGYLSKAHSDQSIVSGGAVEQVALLDEKIAYQRTIIDTNQKLIAQMDEVVNQTLTRTTDAKGAERALQVRRSQGRDRQRLVDEISAAQREIATINEERAPLAVEVRKVESEVGPIKYIAALLYGDNPETNLMERAVRWMIIILVAVFDPLAVALLIAANQTLRRHGIDLEKAGPDDTPNRTDRSDPQLAPTPPEGAPAEAGPADQPESDGTTDNGQDLHLQQEGTVDIEPGVEDPTDRPESVGFDTEPFDSAEKKRNYLKNKS